MPFTDGIKIIITLTSLFILFLLPDVHAINRIRLEVDIDVDQSRINGIEKFHISSGKDVELMTGTLKINDIRLNGTPVSYDEFDGTIRIMAREKGEIVIRYTGIFKDQGVTGSVENPYVQNVIDERGVSLTNLWYPTHGELARYDLRATFPLGYKAISEADDVKMGPKKGKVEYRFRFPYMVDGINLVASDRYEIVAGEFRGIKIYGYFFKEDKELAKTYIEYTKKYLKMYEDLVGMYPFKRFSIVENFLQTGYSMPTYTLLGSAVVRLPFIVKTSLGHEVLHQWFGNSVYIDYDRGNWAEGLTAYLSDHLYREQEGEGWKYRKQILIDYKSYVDVENDVPLKYFRGRVDGASRAIGYGKTALVFHMLKNMVGEKTFYASLKDLIENNRFKRASWNDIRISFERQYSTARTWSGSLHSGLKKKD